MRLLKLVSGALGGPDGGSNRVLGLQKVASWHEGYPAYNGWLKTKTQKIKHFLIFPLEQLVPNLCYRCCSSKADFVLIIPLFIKAHVIENLRSLIILCYDSAACTVVE